MGKASLREEELAGQGWERQCTTDEPRLSELVELYHTLGNEVHLEPFDLQGESGQCQACMAAEPERFKIIYTRKDKDEVDRLFD